jgi:hypothetical protein
MGLDSVELVMQIENYFNIQIPDAEAEKICTVQDMVQAVAGHLKISDGSSTLKDEIFHKLDLALLKLSLTAVPLNPQDHISKYIKAEDKEAWKNFENELDLEVPKPDLTGRDSKSFLNRIKTSLRWKPYYDWQSITVEEFVTIICSANYRTLIDRTNIKSSFEIYAAVMAITVDKTGADYFEIAPAKSFTSDLGID